MNRIFIKELELQASIGIYEREKQAPQRIMVSVFMDVENDRAAESDTIEDTVSYEEVIDTIKKIAAARHYNLVESLAEEIATACLADKRVLNIELEITKPDIFKDAAGVGIKIVRKN